MYFEGNGESNNFGGSVSLEKFEFMTVRLRFPCKRSLSVISKAIFIKALSWDRTGQKCNGRDSNLWGCTCLRSVGYSSMRRTSMALQPMVVRPLKSQSTSSDCHASCSANTNSTERPDSSIPPTAASFVHSDFQISWTKHVFANFLQELILVIIARKS